MRVHKRGGVYQYEFEFRGRNIRRSSKSKSQRVAWAVATAHHTSLVSGESGLVERKPAPSFGKAMKAFLAWSLQEHSSHPGTAERYRYSSIPLLTFFKNVSLDEITPERVEEYKLKRSQAKIKGKGKKKLRPATVNRELACLRALFNNVIKGNDQVRNPVSRVKFLAEDNQQDRVLTYAEESAYLGKASPTLRDVAMLILETGMRPEEIFELQGTSVDIDQRYLRILSGKTAAARRRIELTGTAIELLSRRMVEAQEAADEQQRHVGYLFPNARDTSRPLPGLQSAHARALKDSKVPRFRPYDLRHTWATRAAEAGVDLITLAAMLGHTRIQMVLRYAHPTQDHQTGAMAKVVDHKTMQRAREKAKLEAAETRQAATGMRLVTRTA